MAWSSFVSFLSWSWACDVLKTRGCAKIVMGFFIVSCSYAVFGGDAERVRDVSIIRIRH